MNVFCTTLIEDTLTIKKGADILVRWSSTCFGMTSLQVPADFVEILEGPLRTLSW